MRNSLQNIGKIIEKQNSEQVARNRLQLKVTIDVVKWFLFQEIKDSKFCIIVDEARDFVDKEGFIRRQFFDLVHVKDTTSLALEKTICNVTCEVLLCHFLNVDDIHVAASKEVIPIFQYFSYFTGIINWYNQFDIGASYIAGLIDSGELKTRKGKNQVSTLQCPGDTQWGSHLVSLHSLMRMFDSVYVVLQDTIKFGNLTQKSEANGIYDAMAFVEFVFILHFLIEMLGITDDICQALQYKSQDILKAIEHGWDPSFEKMKSFCKDHEIKVPNLSASSKYRRGRSCIQRDNLTIEHHYRFDIFITGIDSLLTEMNSRFNDEKASIVVELCQVLAKTKKSSIYPLLYITICLVLTLLMSTATIERTFSAMKIVKTRLHNSMEDDFLPIYLVAYIRKKIAQEFSIDFIIDELDLMKKQMV
ncbi:hypothetical protein V6Z12_A07G122800 [Gossypium hirsutum]